LQVTQGLIVAHSTVKGDITIAGSNSEVVSLSCGTINCILKVQVPIPSATEAEVSFKAHRVTIVLVTGGGNITVEFRSATHVSGKASSIDCASKAGSTITISSYFT